MDIGLECYISEHSGFCGQLKKFCEDFVVTEIDKSGCLVKLTSQQIQPDVDKDVDKCHSKVTVKTAKNNGDLQCDNWLVSSESCSNAEKTANTVKDSSLPSTNKYFYKLADITSPDAIQEAFCKLTELVGEIKVLELKDMYIGTQTDAKTITLGCFNNKSDRAIVHLNTRMVFPGINTETINQNGVYSITANVDEVFLDFLALFNEKVTVENLMRFCCCIDKNTPASVDLPFCADKDKRTKIHRSLAKHFGSFLESKTFVSEKQDINKKSCIQIRMRQRKGSSRKGNTQRIDENRQSKNHRGKADIYTGFVLKKENMETLEAIEKLSRALATHPSSFSFAGIKDKKAVTLQNVVAKGITPEQLSAVNTNASLSNMVVGNYRRERKPMEKGQHGGNAFRIVIRDVHLNLQEEKDIRCKDAIDENVKEAVENVKKYGFINYFGRQRFGEDDNTRADEIGLAMLQGDMVKAVKLLLRPSSKNDDTNDAKRYFQETGNVPGTLSRMPQDRSRECLILKSLHRHGQDLDGCTKAFFNIPYSMRLLYAHSYVSLLWNKMASYRMKEYGLSDIVEGDLVHDPSSNDIDTSQSASVRSATTPSENDREDNTDIHSMRDRSDDERNKTLQTDEDNEKIQKDGGNFFATSIFKSQIKVVTEEDVRAARYTTRDLVLPLPGYNVIYPTNRLGDRYQEALEKNGLTSQSFRIRSLGMTLPGAYRKVIAVPLDLEYKWILTDDNKQAASFSPGNTYPLKTNETHIYSLPDKCSVNSGKSESYWVRTNKRERDDTNVSNEGHEPYRKRSKHSGKTSGNCIENNIEMSFKLQPSCYATVCLREIMKT